MSMESRGIGACLRGTVAGLAGSLLSGCIMVGPDFVPPLAPPLAAWSNTGPGISARAQPSIEWWRKFNDPVLTKLVETAFAQNLTLQIAGVRIYEARAQLGIVIGEHYPQSQKVGGGYKKERLSKDVGLLKKITQFHDFDPTFEDWSVGFDASWEIDIWGKVRRGVQAASADLAARIASYDDVRVMVAGDVAVAYVTIREIQTELSLARKNANSQKESLRITEVRFKDGVTTELDVQEATALYNNTNAQIPALEADLVKARNALAVLLGLPPGYLDNALGSRAIPRPPAEIGVGIPADLLRRRPDMRAAEMRAAAQSAKIGVAVADLYPAFGISGAIGFKATDFADLFTGRSLAGMINPGFSWSILNYGRIINNVRVQDARYQEAIVDYQQTVLKAYKEVEDALTAFLKAKQQALYLSRAVAASTKASSIALAQYKEGTADFSRVLNALEGLLHQEQRLAAVRADAVTNLIALYKALGGGWETVDPRTLISQANKDEMSARTNWGGLLDDGSLTPQ